MVEEKKKKKKLGRCRVNKLCRTGAKRAGSRFIPVDGSPSSSLKWQFLQGSFSFLMAMR